MWRFLVAAAVLTAAAGCKPAPVRKVPLVTPAQYRTQKAAVVAQWRAGKLTTSGAQAKLDGLKEGVSDYCSDHYCGEGK